MRPSQRPKKTLGASSVPFCENLWHNNLVAREEKRKEMSMFQPLTQNAAGGHDRGRRSAEGVGLLMERETNENSKQQE